VRISEVREREVREVTEKRKLMIERHRNDSLKGKRRKRRGFKDTDRREGREGREETNRRR
jgi:hypothetical protein